MEPFRGNAPVFNAEVLPSDSLPVPARRAADQVFHCARDNKGSRAARTVRGIGSLDAGRVQPQVRSEPGASFPDKPVTINSVMALELTEQGHLVSSFARCLRPYPRNHSASSRSTCKFEVAVQGIDKLPGAIHGKGDE